ncbi:MAG TPA: hypothetical protein VFE47_03495 [Tepidisphaeraceae bacterium]|nr:hypothetical protein [Tepidisphaeraceae bacterium]
MIRFLLVVVSFSLPLALAANLHAGLTSATFDFESHAATSGGGLTSLSLAKNGIGISIDRAGQPFDVATLSPWSGTSAFGSRSLSPTPPGGNFFNVNFSTPANSFSAQFGDFASTATDSLALTAFSGRNGTGRNLGSAFANLPLKGNDAFAFKTVQIRGENIESVELIGGTPNTPNSVYFDNFHVSAAIGGAGGISAVPLPAGIYVMPLCAVIAWMASRRLRNGRSQTRAGQDRSSAGIRARLGRRQYSRPLHTRVTRGWDQPYLGDL